MACLEFSATFVVEFCDLMSLLLSLRFLHLVDEQQLTMTVVYIGRQCARESCSQFLLFSWPSYIDLHFSPPSKPSCQAVQHMLFPHDAVLGMLRDDEDRVSSFKSYYSIRSCTVDLHIKAACTRILQEYH